jgi:hypothetical protein
MKTKYYIPLFILSVIFILSSCISGKYKKSEKIEQRIIFQNYAVSYNAGTERLYVKASFTVNNPGGISLSLNDGSEVIFNGKSLDGDYYDEEGYLYLDEFDGKLPSELLFQYRNNDDNIFDNRLKINKFEIKNLEQFVISKSAGAMLNYRGPAFSDDEVLLCTLMKGEKSVATLELGIRSSEKVELTPGLLTDIPAGAYECYFTRTLTSSDVKSMDRGGWYSSEYISKKIKIIITE